MRHLALVTAVLASHAGAVDMTIAGMTFGQPVVTKPCTSKVSTKEPCLLTDRVTQLGPNQWVAWMMLPIDRTPQIMVPRPFKIYSQGGALVGVEFSTFGLRTQAWDLGELTRKYGQPAALERRSLQNRLGGKFEGGVYCG